MSVNDDDALALGYRHLLPRERPTPEALWWNFLRFSTFFAITHGAVTVCVSYSVAYLGTYIGGISGGVLYVTYALTALAAAKPLLAGIGPQRTLATGLTFHTVYVTSFLVALLFPAIDWIFIVGSFCGGVASGLLWPAQGAYYAANAKAYSVATTDDVAETNSTFASSFAMVYLFVEAGLKLLATGALLAGGGAAALPLFIFYTVAAGTCAAGTALAISDLDMRGEGLQRGDKVMQHASGVLRLMASSRTMLYLSPMMLLFGWMLSFFPGYVDGVIVPEGVGAAYIGLLSGLVTITAASSARPVAWLSNRAGKAASVTLGICMFFLTGLALFFASNKVLGGWQFIVIYHLVFGLGRGVFENVVRAIVADYFQHAVAGLQAAYGCVSLLNGVGGGVGFFILASLSRTALGLATLGLAGLSLLAFYALNSGLAGVKPGQADVPTEESDGEIVYVKVEGDQSPAQAPPVDA